MDSILNQKNANFEVIVSDDGSKENYFVEVIKYFEEKGFWDYSIVHHPKNVGTVKNVFNALNIANSKYVKVISPGDALVSADTIRSWVDFLDKTGRHWSFGDALYYRRSEDNKLVFTKQLCNPQIVDCYLRHDEEKCRVNYVGLDDIALGAAILSETKIMLRYLKRIVGKCIFAEDNIYRLMVFDNIIPEYYPNKVIFYEYGTGISTSCNENLSKKLLADWRNADKIMFATNPKDEFQKMLADIYKRKNSQGFVNRIRKLFVKGQFRMVIFRRLRPRMSDTKL